MRRAENNVKQVLEKEVFCGWEKACGRIGITRTTELCSLEMFSKCSQRKRFDKQIQKYQGEYPATEEEKEFEVYRVLGV